MSEWDKIRILWIDDREEMDGYPESVFPEPFAPWFEVVHPGSRSGPASYRSAAEFAPQLKSFWFDRNREILPVEIIATDYNLSKRSGTAIGQETDEEVRKTLSLDNDEKSAGGMAAPTVSNRSFNFEGLLIALFYGSLTYHHPAAIVPMTRYLTWMPSEVETLHKLVEPFLGVDFTRIGLRDRKWANIIVEGVKSLRQRIKELYTTGEIVLSFSDLMDLAEDTTPTGDPPRVLTFHSPYATRKLPLYGLFVDIPEPDRNKQIRAWAEELLALAGGSSELRQAKELARTVLDAYFATGSSDLVSQREQLSRLLAEKARGTAIEQKELDQLITMFKVKGDRCNQQCVDITCGKHPDRIQRWAALIVIFEALKTMIRVGRRIEQQTAEARDGAPMPQPTLTVEDLYLALFPVPATPLILPWHEEGKKRSINKGSGWVRALMRLGICGEVDDNIGNLALHLPDVWAGEGWLAPGPHGLRPAERLILRSFALDEPELVPDGNLEASSFASYDVSRRILWGKMLEPR